MVSVCGYARQISEDEAAAIATEFLNSTTVRQTPAKTAVHRAKAPNADTAPFYVFNADNSQGFVIVSADDRAQRILGYSDKGTFDFNNLPPQLNAMLENYGEQIKNIPANTPTHASWKTPKRVSEEGGVLLETANWGQGAPYNSQCPIIDGEHAPTGCVATAMAIVMKYHNWPEHTYGKEVTNFYHKDITIDFSDSQINWSNLEENSDSFTNDVSRLMLLTGTSVHTHYETDDSGALMHGICHELITTFGYDTQCCYLTRRLYDDQEWRSLIDEQLNNGLPIIYGSTIENTWQGHTYVLDGKAGEMYHINWGWDGDCNGFYDLDFLKPNNDNYSDHQSMIINIKPDPNPKTQLYSPLHVVYGWNKTFRTGQINSTTSEIHKNEIFAFTGPVISHPSFHGYVNYALIDENDNIVELATNYGYPPFYQSSADKYVNIAPENFIPRENGCRLDGDNVTLPITAFALSDFLGSCAFTKTNILPSHRIVLVSKEDSDNEWKQVLGLNGTLNYVPTQGIQSQWAEVEWIFNSDLIDIKHALVGAKIVGESLSRILRYQSCKDFNLMCKTGRYDVYINDILIDNSCFSDDCLGEFIEKIENEYPRLCIHSNLPKYTIKIDYTPDPYVATNIHLEPDNVTLSVGESVTLTAIISPEETKNKNLFWTSSCDAIATVDQQGHVTGLSDGGCFVTAKTTDGSDLSASCMIMVKEAEILVSSISLNPSAAAGEEGELIQLNATVLPEDATNKTVEWKSSDESVATVDGSGLVPLHKKGTAVITASATDGSGVSAECTVVVTEYAGIKDILTDKDIYVKIFNLQGIKVYEGMYSEANLAPDYYIVVCDGKYAKVKVE